MRIVFLLVAGIVLMLVSGCPTKARLPYQKAMAMMQGHNYGGALVEFEKSLAADPEQRMALFGKARCLYELGRYEEALPCFEEFLNRTSHEKTKYSDERFDAEFYRDKCKLELGIEVPQDPNAIPPERMGG